MEDHQEFSLKPFEYFYLNVDAYCANVNFQLLLEIYFWKYRLI